ncbi:hypothetical protein R83H12_00145 [Fibrobacteria bacterium R8-3-H12]
MEMAVAELATTQKAAEIGTAVGIAVLKEAQQAGENEALALLQTLPQAPSIGGIGSTVDISV